MKELWTFLLASLGRNKPQFFRWERWKSLICLPVWAQACREVLSEQKQTELAEQENHKGLVESWFSESEPTPLSQGEMVTIHPLNLLSVLKDTHPLFIYSMFVVNYSYEIEGWVLLRNWKFRVAWVSNKNIHGRSVNWSGKPKRKNLAYLCQGDHVQIQVATEVTIQETNKQTKATNQTRNEYK